MPKEDWKNNTVYSIFTEAGLWPWGEGEIKTVLDVTCGLSFKSKYIPADIRVGVDIFEEYFNFIETDLPYVVIKHDVRNLNEIFLPNSFDMVIALDIIEHLEKEESLEMIKQCEEIAKKAVILETPRGFIPQNIDILGHGGDEFQTHRCGWEKEELEQMGYSTVVRDYEMSNVKRHTDIEVESSVQLLDAIKVFK
ncbi:MAG: class I SAM-dependent methyltransferase [Candidatus Magasanikbacteria bacterium]